MHACYACVDFLFAFLFFLNKPLSKENSRSTGPIFSERTTLRLLYAIGRPSVCLSVVCLSVVCDVGAPYSGG